MEIYDNLDPEGPRPRKFPSTNKRIVVLGVSIFGWIVVPMLTYGFPRFSPSNRAASETCRPVARRPQPRALVRPLSKQRGKPHFPVKLVNGGGPRQERGPLLRECPPPLEQVRTPPPSRGAASSALRRATAAASGHSLRALAATHNWTLKGAPTVGLGVCRLSAPAHGNFPGPRMGQSSSGCRIRDMGGPIDSECLSASRRRIPHRTGGSLPAATPPAWVCRTLRDGAGQASNP